MYMQWCCSLVLLPTPAQTRPPPNRSPTHSNLTHPPLILRCRDALFLGDCDDGVRQLCQLLGWEADLDALVAAGRAQFEAAHPAAAGEAAEAAAGGGADAVLKATAEAAAEAPEPAGEAAAAAEGDAGQVEAKAAAQAAL